MAAWSIKVPADADMNTTLGLIKMIFQLSHFAQDYAKKW